MNRDIELSSDQSSIICVEDTIFSGKVQIDHNGSIV